MKQEVIQGEDPYCCNLSKEVQEVAKVELNETAKVRKKALAEVRKWIRSQPQIKSGRRPPMVCCLPWPQLIELSV